MRSEGNGHLAPAEFPGLALVDAWRRHTPVPLIAALFDAYTPSLELLLAQGTTLAERSGFHTRKVSARVEAIWRMSSPQPCFTLADSNGCILGQARHIILALGQANPGWPVAVRPWRAHPRVTHAYVPHTIQPGMHVVVLGSGMAAAHIWFNALQAGARVTGVHRHPLRRQKLNAPRCDFTTPGIEAYQRLPPEQRLAYLQRVGQGSFPWRWQWEWAWVRARCSGHLKTHLGELVGIQEDASATVEPPLLALHLNNQSTLLAEHLICATGFEAHASGYRLIRQMITTGGARTYQGLLLLEDDFTLSPLSQPESACFVVGSLARWALPVANTFVGMKYAARRIAAQLGAHTSHLEGLYAHISGKVSQRRFTL
jgi:hypothetical protein